MHIQIHIYRYIHISNSINTQTNIYSVLVMDDDNHIINFHANDERYSLDQIMIVFCYPFYYSLVIYFHRWVFVSYMFKSTSLPYSVVICYVPWCLPNRVANIYNNYSTNIIIIIRSYYLFILFVQQQCWMFIVHKYFHFCL